VYSVAYTQLSFWQFYADSAYFRESNYNPEFFVTILLADAITRDFLKGTRIGLAHQSKGRGGRKERSWNYVHAALFFQYKSFSLS